MEGPARRLNDTQVGGEQASVRPETQHSTAVAVKCAQLCNYAARRTSLLLPAAKHATGLYMDLLHITFPLRALSCP
jgi:hypothetical protein